MTDTPRYAIITPYYKEERRLIERCMASVRSQSVRADHFLVADGYPQDWIDGTGVRHFKLDRSHGDFGNTPRGVGALIAIAEEYSGIGLLDADNWLEPNHVEACVTAAAMAEPCDYVMAQRMFRRPDESIMPLLIDPKKLDVDTNCFFFLRGAFGVLPHWAMMPRQLSPFCDEFFFKMLRQRGLVAARAQVPTVNYLNMWSHLYEELGEAPPPGAKPPFDGAEVTAWIKSLSPRDNEIAGRLAGFLMPGATRADPSGSKSPAKPAQGKVGRNDRCPCGSGRKYKHCHGASGTHAPSTR
jgi:hypothetical protein